MAGGLGCNKAEPYSDSGDKEQLRDFQNKLSHPVLLNIPSFFCADFFLFPHYFNTFFWEET